MNKLHKYTRFWTWATKSCL